MSVLYPDPSATGPKSIVDLIYPVGSIYMSVASTSPATLFGGTWEALRDRFLVGASDPEAENPDFPAADTGGAASVSYTPSGLVGSHTLTVDEIPSHNHSFTGSAVTSGGISANHTHTGTSGNPSANHYHSGPSHSHQFRVEYGGTPVADSDHNPDGNGYYCAVSKRGGIWNTGSAGTGGTGTVSAWHTHTTTTGNQSAGHTHSVTASGSIGNKGGGGGHDHSFTGTAATIDTLPPYLSVYMWKRTA